MTIPFSGNIPRGRPAAAPRGTGRSRSGPACASYGSSRTPATRGRTSSCASASARRSWPSRPTSFTPEAIHYSPAGGVPAGDYFAEVCDLQRAAATGDVHRHVHHRRHRGANPVPRALAGLPGQPAARHPARLPLGKPEHRHPRALVLGRRRRRRLRPRRRQPRLAAAPWDFNLRANAPTLTTIGNNANTATSWTHSEVPSPPAYMPTSPARDYSVPVDERLVHGNCNPTPGAPGSTWDDGAAVDQPVRRPQPHARLRRTSWASPSETGTPRTSTSA